jgi:hypothetical protein
MQMRLWGLTSVFVLLLTACTTPEKTSAPAQTEFRPTATIKDIMDSVIDPSADELWESVSTTVDATGLHEKFPQTDEEWKEVRRDAIRLIEGHGGLESH